MKLISNEKSMKNSLTWKRIFKMTEKEYFDLLKEFNLEISYDVGYFKNYPVCGYRIHKSNFCNFINWENNSLIIFEKYSKSKKGPITGQFIGKYSTTVKIARILISSQIKLIKQDINTNKIKSISEDFS